MAWWRSRRGRVRIPTLPSRDIDDDPRLAKRVADFLQRWSVARQQARESTTRPESEPRPLMEADQWRTVLALGDADAAAMTTIVLAAVRWAFQERYRAGTRAGRREQAPR